MQTPIVHRTPAGLDRRPVAMLVAITALATGRGAAAGDFLDHLLFETDDLRADPDAIGPGQAATLRWSGDGATSCGVDPGNDLDPDRVVDLEACAVDPHGGSLEVRPGVTSAYGLTRKLRRTGEHPITGRPVDDSLYGSALASVPLIEN